MFLKLLILIGILFYINFVYSFEGIEELYEHYKNFLNSLDKYKRYISNLSFNELLH